MVLLVADQAESLRTKNALEVPKFRRDYIIYPRAISSRTEEDVLGQDQRVDEASLIIQGKDLGRDYLPYHIVLQGQGTIGTSYIQIPLSDLQSIGFGQAILPEGMTTSQREEVTLGDMVHADMTKHLFLCFWWLGRWPVLSSVLSGSQASTHWYEMKYDYYGCYFQVQQAIVPEQMIIHICPQNLSSSTNHHRHNHHCLLLGLLRPAYIIILWMYTKSQVKQRLAEIQLEQQSFDQKFDRLHRLLTDTRSSTIPVHRLRADFQKIIPELRDISRTHLAQLQTLRQTCQRLHQEGQDMTITLHTVDSHCEYFQQFQQKVKNQQTRGEQRLAERERWELTQGGEHDLADQQARLMVAGSHARETREMAGQVLASLQSQTNRLQSARERMGNVLRNINLSGNLLQLIRNRSRQDNRLIFFLSIGLIVEAILCIYVIRPLIRSS